MWNKLKKNYMFTNKSHPERGIMSTILGILSDGAIGLAVFSSFKTGGNESARLACAVMLALIFSIVGLVLGILSRIEKDRFYLFPNLGIILNSVAVIAIAFILYIGVFGL
ncbi:MAG: hypothetical protein IJZ76_03745 [Lachnospiraceae bacterium]|nr:hypothetical protein [Lachnospiraceae bacterium]